MERKGHDRVEFNLKTQVPSLLLVVQLESCPREEHLWKGEHEALLTCPEGHVLEQHQC